MTGRSKFESIGTALQRRLRQHGLAETVQATQICQAVDQLSAGRFAAVRFRDGTLTVRAINAPAAQELRLQREKLLAQLKQCLHWPANRPLRLRILL